MPPSDAKLGLTHQFRNSFVHCSSFRSFLVIQRHCYVLSLQQAQQERPMNSNSNLVTSAVLLDRSRQWDNSDDNNTDHPIIRYLKEQQQQQDPGYLRRNDAKAAGRPTPKQGSHMSPEEKTNLLRLRSELRGAGVEFKSNSATSLLAHAFGITNKTIQLLEKAPTDLQRKSTDLQRKSRKPRSLETKENSARKNFEEKFQLLQAWKQRHNHCNVSTRHPTLGWWVKKMRRREYYNKEKNSLPPYLEERLVNLGFQFPPNNDNTDPQQQQDNANSVPTARDQEDNLKKIDFVTDRIHDELSSVLEPGQFKVVKLSGFQLGLRDEFIAGYLRRNKGFSNAEVSGSEKTTKYVKWDGTLKDINDSFCQGHPLLIQKFLPALAREIVGDDEAECVPLLLKTEGKSHFQVAHLDYIRKPGDKDRRRNRNIPPEGYHAWSFHGGGKSDCYLNIWKGKNGEGSSALPEPTFIKIPYGYALALRWDVIHAGHFVRGDQDPNTRFFANMLPKHGFEARMDEKFKWDCLHFPDDPDFEGAIPIIS